MIFRQDIFTDSLMASKDSVETMTSRLLAGVNVSVKLPFAVIGGDTRRENSDIETNRFFVACQSEKKKKKKF